MENEKSKCSGCSRREFKRMFGGNSSEKECERCLVEEDLKKRLKNKIEADPVKAALEAEGIQIIECPKCEVKTGIDCDPKKPKPLEWKCKNCKETFEIEYFIDPETGEEVIYPNSPPLPKYPLFPGFEKEQEKQG